MYGKVVKRPWTQKQHLPVFIIALLVVACVARVVELQAYAGC